jgi:hypothetical protein
VFSEASVAVYLTNAGQNRDVTRFLRKVFRDLT